MKEKYKHIHNILNAGPDNIVILFNQDGSVTVDNPNCDGESRTEYRFIDGWWQIEPCGD